MSQSELDRLAAKFAAATERANGGAKFGRDERIWTCTTDKAGNGNAVLRFLPALPGEDPYEQRWEYFFKGPTNKYYVANSLETLGQDDPVRELNRKLWEGGDKVSKEIKDLRGLTKSKMYVYVNALVVKDPGNRENEGKVFLYRFGKKIMEKVNRKLNPGVVGLEKVNVFDPVEGCDFFLIQAKVSDGKGGPGFPNYDASEWGPVRAIPEAQVKAALAARYSLKELVAPDKFPTYEDAKKKLNEVLALNPADEPEYDLPENDETMADDELDRGSETSDTYTEFADLQRRV